MELRPVTPTGKPRAALPWERGVVALGGIARTRDLRAMGMSDQDIRFAVGYGNLRRVRNGWYTLPGVDARLIEAVRLGGRLACVSALAFHADGGADAAASSPGDGCVHIEVPANVPTPRAARAAGARIHWARTPSPGTNALVDRDTAVRQARECSAAREQAAGLAGNGEQAAREQGSR